MYVSNFFLFIEHSRNVSILRDHSRHYLLVYSYQTYVGKHQEYLYFSKSWICSNLKSWISSNLFKLSHSSAMHLKAEKFGPNTLIFIWMQQIWIPRVMKQKLPFCEHVLAKKEENYMRLLPLNLEVKWNWLLFSANFQIFLKHIHVSPQVFHVHAARSSKFSWF